MNDSTIFINQLNNFIQLTNTFGFCFIAAGIAKLFECYASKKFSTPDPIWPFFLILPMIWAIVSLPFYLNLSQIHYLITHLFTGGTVFTRHILTQLLIGSAALIMIFGNYEILERSISRLILGTIIVYSGYQMKIVSKDFIHIHVDYKYWEVNIISLSLMATGLCLMLRTCIPQYLKQFDISLSSMFIFTGALFILIKPEKIIPIGTMLEHGDFQAKIMLFLLAICFVIVFSAIIKFLIKEYHSLNK